MKNEKNITIDLSDNVSLQNALKNVGVYSLAKVTKLTVTGTFHRFHFIDIFKEKTSLRELDLSAANYNAYFKKEPDYRSHYFYQSGKYYYLLWIEDDNHTLEKISFPSSVTMFDPDLWYHFSNLKSIVVPDNHKFFCVENDVLFNKDKSVLVRYPTGRKGEYIIPESVTILEEGAFQSSTGLNSVILPSSLKEIRESGFEECSGLKSIIIPEKLEIIGRSAFNECTGLTSIIIPQSVEIIDDYAFSGCTGLKSVKIINPAIKLGEQAFSSCSALSSVDMPKSVKYKRSEAFYGCDKLSFMIEKEYNQIKQEKVKKITKMSAYDWLENLMKNSNYTYKINKSYTTKLQLSVMINDKQKLEIPIPYSQFQKILPRIMDAIKRFEESIKEFDFVYVEKINTEYDRTGWTNMN